MNMIPLMGMGTFIGIEADHVQNLTQRYSLTTEMIYSALAKGYRHIDLAENYHNLPAVAAALTQAFQPLSANGLGLKREDIWLTMKAVQPYTDAHITELLNAVGVGYFDLFLIHFPTAGGLFDDKETLTAKWRALAQMGQDKIKRIGVSNFYEPHLQRLLAVCEEEELPFPYANQCLINPWAPNTSLVDFCEAHGIGVMAYSPLGYAYAPLILADDTLQTIAKELNATPAQVVLAWLMKKEIRVIPKTNHHERLVENYDSQRLVPLLTPEHMHAIDGITPPFPMSTDTSESCEKHGNDLSWGNAARLGMN